MSERFQTVANSSERRVYPRQQVLFSCVQLEDENGGIILDISEDGLAMQTVRSLADGQSPKMRFQFSQSQAWIDAKGRITWISDTNRTAGVEFIDLPDEARKQIKAWMSLTSDAGGSDDATLPVEKTGQVSGETTVAGPISASPLARPRIGELFPDDRRPLPMRESILSAADEIVTDSSVRARRGGLSLVAVLLLSAFAFISLGYYFPKARNSHKDTRTTRELKPLVLPPQKFPNLTSSPEPSFNVSAFVLQVGAMVHEVRAEALTESLRQKNFPAFVSKRGTNRLYYVVVGPYYGVDATVKVKEELKNQGFEVIRTEWKPSGDDKKVAKAQPAEAASQSKDKGEGELALARRYLREANMPGFGPTAVHHLWLAIEKGNRSAEVELADLYLRGEVVPKNCEQARILASAARNARDSAVALNLPELPEDECK